MAVQCLNSYNLPFNICITIFIKLDLYLFGLFFLHGSSLLSNRSLPLLLQLIWTCIQKMKRFTLVKKNLKVTSVIVLYFVLNKLLKNEGDSPTSIMAHMLSAPEGKHEREQWLEQLKSTHSCLVGAAHAASPAAPGSAVWSGPVLTDAGTAGVHFPGQMSPSGRPGPWWVQTPGPAASLPGSAPAETCGHWSGSDAKLQSLRSFAPAGDESIRFFLSLLMTICWGKKRVMCYIYILGWYCYPPHQFITGAKQKNLKSPKLQNTDIKCYYGIQYKSL